MLRLDHYYRLSATQAISVHLRKSEKRQKKGQLKGFVAISRYFRVKKPKNSVLQVKFEVQNQKVLFC